MGVEAQEPGPIEPIEWLRERPSGGGGDRGRLVSEREVAWERESERESVEPEASSCSWWRASRRTAAQLWGWGLGLGLAGVGVGVRRGWEGPYQVDEARSRVGGRGPKGGAQLGSPPRCQDSVELHIAYETDARVHVSLLSLKPQPNPLAQEVTRQWSLTPKL